MRRATQGRVVVAKDVLHGAHQEDDGEEAGMGMKMYSSKHRWTRADRTKLVSLVKIGWITNKIVSSSLVLR